MLMIRRVLLAILFIPLLASGQPLQTSDVWLPFQYFLGTWKGTGKGEPGISQLEREYKLVLGGKFLNVDHKSVYQPQEKNTKGEKHEDWGFFSYDRTRKLYVLRQFHVEGFVTQYRSETTAPDGKTLVFTSESLENLPAGFRARETYRVLSDDELSRCLNWPPQGKNLRPIQKTISNARNSFFGDHTCGKCLVVSSLSCGAGALTGSMASVSAMSREVNSSVSLEQQPK